VYSMLCTVCCVQYVVYSMFTVCCVQYVVYSMLCTVCCVQYVVYSMLCTVCCVQYVCSCLPMFWEHIGLLFRGPTVQKEILEQIVLERKMSVSLPEFNYSSLM
jgi:hypothetical protein